MDPSVCIEKSTGNALEDSMEIMHFGLGEISRISIAIELVLGRFYSWKLSYCIETATNFPGGTEKSNEWISTEIESNFKWYSMYISNALFKEKTGSNCSRGQKRYSINPTDISTNIPCRFQWIMEFCEPILSFMGLRSTKLHCVINQSTEYLNFVVPLKSLRSLYTIPEACPWGRRGKFRTVFDLYFSLNPDS